MYKRLIEKSYAVNDVTGTSYSDNIDLEGARTISVQAVVDVDTPAAATFTAAVTDIITATAHDFTTGLKVRVSSDTTLPAGLAGATDYYVVVIDANTFKLSDTLAHALAGTNYIDITNTGTGIHTITPSSLAGGTWTLQQSNDNSNWADVASATNVTADASFLVEKVDPTTRYMRIKCVVTAGRYSSENYVLIKGKKTI
jgi:hypothetical protein